MTMIQTIPTFEEELEALRPLLPTLYEAFEFGTEMAVAYFRAKPVSLSLAAHLVRYHAGEFLREQGHVVDDLDCEELANDGICLSYAGRRVRLWKSGLGELPLAGDSRVKRAFLNQQLPLFLGNEVQQRIGPNLAVLWTVGADYRLTTLYLALPKLATSNVSQAYWTEPIEHPLVSGDIYDARVAEEDEASKALPIKRLETPPEESEQAK